MISPVPSRVRWLYVDFNAFFASVEQTLRAELRGKPIAVVPVQAVTTCCIACSYEAKQFGVKTGMDIAEAQRLCPELRLIVARQREYAACHRRFVQVIKRCIPIRHVRSIDEVACLLDSRAASPEDAMEVARRIKRELADEFGGYLRCSIGIAPNELLAKIAAGWQKPNGLYLLEPETVKEHLMQLGIRDVPGIGERMELRLLKQGIRTTSELLSLTPKQMRAVWGSLEGERLWYRLHGYDFDLPATAQSTIGHEHVLPPGLRTREQAGAVARKLLCRAARRLREQKLWAKGLSVYLSFSAGREKQILECHTRVAEAQDDTTLLQLLSRIWSACPDGKPTFVGVTLYDLIPDAQHTGWLFEQDELRSRVHDSLRGDLEHKIYPASVHAIRHAAQPQIAFRSIPDFENQRCS
ncbi:MAG: DNA polymerase [Acidobacteria bacterium]|nr:DNA polymerase [Acidobacteriota bacterium]